MPAQCCSVIKRALQSTKLTMLIAVLAGTITLTPGTVSADLCADGGALLVHCLETDDPEGTVARIKERYEDRLRRIFE